jgi:hypothetical protein
VVDRTTVVITTGYLTTVKLTGVRSVPDWKEKESNVKDVDVK